MTIPTDGRIDLDALAELARKATPGPWRVASDLPAYAIMAMTPEGKGGHRVVQTPNQNNYRRFGPSNGWDGISQIANAAFIAALDPQTVLTLIDLARRAAIPSEQGEAVPTDDALAWFNACWKLSGTGMSKVQFLAKYRAHLGVSSEVAERMRTALDQGELK